MKLKTISITAIAFMFAAGAIFTSCNKTNETDNDTVETSDAAMLERTNDNALTILDQANTGTLGQYKTRGCGSITNDTISNPHVLTVDFGTTNCLCGDGKNRRGTIVCTYMGKYKDSGSVHTITTPNYFVNDNEILAHKTVTNLGKNATGHSTYSIVVNDTINKANNAGTISWNMSRQREFFAGESTPIFSDDLYHVTGSGSGIKANGNSWTMNITNYLVMDNSCVYHITQGTVQLQPQGKALRTIDFGTGTCDNNATVTINNHVYNISF